MHLDIELRKCAELLPISNFHCICRDHFKDLEMSDEIIIIINSIKTYQRILGHWDCIFKK